MQLAAYLAAICLAACATTNQAPSRRVVEPEWGDWPEAIGWIACAVEKVDGADYANRLLGLPIVVMENYHLSGGCYDPDDRQDDGCYGDRPPPAIYLNSNFPTAWASALRYEVIGRRGTHLKEGDPRLCDWTRWKKEIEPLYARALTDCSNKDLIQ